MDWPGNDTIAAIAGVIAAVTAAVTAVMIWQDRRQRRQDELPVVEQRLDQSVSGKAYLEVVVRNRSDAVLVVDSLRVQRPRGMLVSNEEEISPIGEIGLSDSRDAARVSVGIDLDVQPSGASAAPGSHAAMFGGRSDVLRIRLRAFDYPPRRFRMEIVLIMSSRSSAKWRRRIVTTSNVTPRTASDIAATASETDARA
jgi:hypothetical protein